MTTHRLVSPIRFAAALGAVLLAVLDPSPAPGEGRDALTGTATVAPSLEDRTPDGKLYTASVLSTLRGQHCLESVRSVELSVGADGVGTVQLVGPHGTALATVANVPFHLLTPRLFHAAAAAGDASDRFNLMMAEFSRNGLWFPFGEAGSAGAHFEWPGVADGAVDAALSTIRPKEIAVVNNCLRSQLWEIAANDDTGEIYHAWFTFPEDLYSRLVGEANGLDAGSAMAMVAWDGASMPVALDRLRADRTVVASGVAASVIETSDVTFCSGESKRKTERGFVRVASEDGTGVAAPKGGHEIRTRPCHFASFIEPGKYSMRESAVFDYDFLTGPTMAEVATVRPLTRIASGAAAASARAVEIRLALGGHTLLLGNLPESVLKAGNEFAMHGFGVGVPPPSQKIAEREAAIAAGVAPSFCFVLEGADAGGGGDEAPVAANSHAKGIEQVFVVTRPAEGGAAPWWEITVTSYERVVDVVKYRVEIPAALAKH